MIHLFHSYGTVVTISYDIVVIIAYGTFVSIGYVTMGVKAILLED